MSNESSHDFSKIREIIADIKVAMLVTADDNLSMHARPMHTAEVDSDNNIWFLTRDDSGKVAEMINDHHVNLTYACPKDGTYLSVSGVASFNDNLARKEELFNVIAKAWFPEGPEDPDLLLLKVDPDKAEYWDTSSNKLVQLFGIAKAIVREQTYSGGAHVKVKNL